MAVYFSIKKDAKVGMTPVFIRARARKLNVDIRMFIKFQVDAKKWLGAHSSATALANFRKTEYGKEIYSVLDQISNDLEAEFSKGIALTTAQASKIVDDIIYAEQRKKDAEEAEAAAAAAAAEKKVTLRKFIDQYRKDIKSGARMTDKGTLYSPGTINGINMACERLKKFEASKKHIYDFDEIDMNFYREYTAYLNKQGYAINTTGKCIKQLKAIMALAESEGYHSNHIYASKKFKGTRVEVDSIYLTKEDLEKIKAVDLSKRTYGFDLARDIFFVGIWTAQRVSDYNNIHKDDIETYQMRSIVDVPDPENPGKTIAKIETKDVKVINIRQKKTGAKVAIPCSPDLIKILEKYNYDIPHLSDQNINDNIKEIARLAGLTEKVSITTSKGGKMVTEMIEKYKLVHSHTARRTGATLMYLSGMDVYDIMKITGHSTPVMLKKYIKADELEVVDKIMGKYDYFK